jgi:pyruvate/2-oxoglutarate dehydrogenase complex dihydrolipoamide acyltransferase (E2) component
MDVVVPKVGLTIEEVEVVEWLVPIGGEVHAGQPVVLVNADKADLEVESPTDGVLSAIAADAGAVVGVGGVLGTISASGVPEASPLPTIASPAPSSHAPAPAPATPVRSGMPAEGRRRASSPRARAVARALAVDLAAVDGSGPGGRVVERDVRAAADTGRSLGPASGTGSAACVAKVTVQAARAVARQRELRAQGIAVRFADLVTSSVAQSWAAQGRELHAVCVARSRVDGGGWSELALKGAAVAEVVAARTDAESRAAGDRTGAVVIVDASEDAVDEVLVPLPAGASIAVGIGALAQRPVAVRGQLDVRETVTVTFTADPVAVPAADLVDLAGRVVDSLEHG